jgi:DNA-binding NtrC family response regulator
MPGMSDVADRGGTEVNASVAGGWRSGLPRISAVAGPGAGPALAMAHVVATVGRHPTNDLALDDRQVSGVHLELHRVGDRIRVRDAGSTNGTWIGPHRITEVELAPGAELTVGGTRLRFDVDGGASPAVVGSAKSFGQLVGESTVMRELFALLERVAPKNLSVLVVGETGTGKEEVARAIHDRSRRAAKPFIVIDASALPEALASSLLFGHEKGAFTGAERRAVGPFEAAEGGTVFLDEVGELPAAIQSKFLRVLEQREITRVGSHQPVRVDVRIIAATHRDLRHEIDSGRFREDLYYRLAQIRVGMPPLRDRLEDIPILCQKLLGGVQDEGERVVLHEGALAHLSAQPWPGNVRELRNVLARATALCGGGVIRRADVAGEGFGFRGTREERSALDLSGKFAPAKERAIERFESVYLAALLRRCEGNLSRAAREADLARHYLRDLLKKRGLYAAPGSDTDEER